MPRPTKLKQAESAIIDTLAETGTRVLGYSDLRNALRQNRMSWGLKATTTLPDFKAFHERLLAAGKPRKVVRIALARKLLVQLNAKARDVRNHLATA